MDIVEDDDDFYAPDEPTIPDQDETHVAASKDAPAEHDEDLEEGEEEDEGVEMDEDDSVCCYAMPID
jgi:pre-mRNA 3'-end-processing factor FIP1